MTEGKWKDDKCTELTVFEEPVANCMLAYITL
jgi:hypothetical protein